MSKFLRRTLGLAMFGVLGFVSVLGVFAEGISPRYSYINHITAGITINGSTVEYSGTAGPISNDHRAKVTVTLQRRLIEGGAWSSVESIVDYGDYASFAAGSGTHTVNANYEYRTYVRCTIYDSAGIALETKSCYSNVARP